MRKNKTPSVIVEMRSGNCKLQNKGRSLKNELHKQFSAYEVELQISHRICNTHLNHTQVKRM